MKKNLTQVLKNMLIFIYAFIGAFINKTQNFPKVFYVILWVCQLVFKCN